MRRSCQTIAGATGRPLVPFPDDGRLALVRDPDRLEVDAATRRLGERGRRRLHDALPDLLGIVLDPARLREVLRQLAVAAAEHAQVVVDDQARRAGRPLVDREDHACASMNASVRRHASSDASANVGLLAIEEAVRRAVVDDDLVLDAARR